MIYLSYFDNRKKNKYQLFKLLIGRESRVLVLVGFGIGGVIFRGSFRFLDWLFGDRYRGLNGWNFDEVTRVTPPGEKGEPGDAFNDFLKKSK